MRRVCEWKYTTTDRETETSNETNTRSENMNSNRYRSQLRKEEVDGTDIEPKDKGAGARGWKRQINMICSS